MSQAISEGDGISVIVGVPGLEPARGGLDDENLPELRARALRLDRVLIGEEPASAVELLPDRPAGRLEIAGGHGSKTDELAELERAGSDAVLVGDAPPAA